MKKEFETNSGHKGMIINCGDYDVEIFKSIDSSIGSAIKYIHKKMGNIKYTPPVFIIDWDEEADGGRIQIYNRDRWGSEMIFIHYMPSDLKGMFDFIGKGYDIFNTLNN